MTVGISDYAQQELGDVVYVEIPGAGEEVAEITERAMRGELDFTESFKRRGLYSLAFLHYRRTSPSIVLRKVRRCGIQSLLIAQRPPAR